MVIIIFKKIYREENSTSAWSFNSIYQLDTGHDSKPRTILGATDIAVTNRANGPCLHGGPVLVTSILFSPIKSAQILCIKCNQMGSRKWRSCKPKLPITFKINNNSG